MLCPTDPKGNVSTSAGLLLFGAKQKAKFKVGSLCNPARGNDSDYSDRHRSLPAFCKADVAYRGKCKLLIPVRVRSSAQMTF